MRESFGGTHLGSRLGLLGLLLLAHPGCKEEEPDPLDTVDEDEDDDDDDETSLPTETTPSKPTKTTSKPTKETKKTEPTEPTDTTPPKPKDTGDTGEIEGFDCSAIPTSPTSVAHLKSPRGYHDLAFTTDGYVIGSDNSSLWKVRYDNTSELFVPGLGVVQGMNWLHDGDLVVAVDLNRTLTRVNAKGGTSTLATDVGAYGVIVGPDSYIYTANYQSIHRIDPKTGDKEVLISKNRVSPRVLNFSPDFSKLYVGTYMGNGGKIYEVTLDKNLDPVGGLTVFATGVGTGSYHDALEVDACGNIYVVDYSTSTLWRITPAGKVSNLHNFGSRNYGHGITWGNGVDGWRDDAIYLPQPYNGNKVVEVVIEVPSREYTGKVILAP